MTAAILVEESGDNRIVIVPGALADADARRTWTASRRRSRPPTSCSSSWRSRSRRRCTRSTVGARGRRPHRSSTRRPAPPEPIAPVADYVVPNETEAPARSGARRRRSSSRSASRARGSATTSSRRSRRAPSTRTGAGDAFCAAFAVALAEGAYDLDAVRWGCAAGAHMVEHAGAFRPPAARARGTP